MISDLEKKSFRQAQDKATLVRKWSLISTTEAASGHPTSCLSAADIGTVLFDSYFSYDIKNPHNQNNDKFILSKGHAAPLFYTLFALSGAMPLEKLRTLRKFGSPLEGHPMPVFPYTIAATGSLGQGLSVGAGTALVAKREKLSYKTYVLLGDGEMAEGSVWEAANFASHYALHNLIAIVDVNRFGQSQETMFGHDIEAYIQRFTAFDWEVIAIDGHDLKEIDKAFSLAVNNKRNKPFVIVAKTKKGKGVSLLEDKDGWHGKPLKKEDLVRALEELGEVDDSLRFKLKKPKDVTLNTFDKLSVNSVKNPRSFAKAQDDIIVKYKKGEEVATREVYGQVLTQLGKTNSLIYALDGDTKNSTYSQDFLKVFPERFVECFIAEQNMVGVALGLSKVGKLPFSSTFSAFLTRAFDQIRMSRISDANMKFIGSHSGVSIGEDGASQMGLEDFALFGSLPDSVIFHPSDAVSTAKVLPLMIDHKGISYLRTLRPKTPVIYNADEKFKIGGSKILRKSKNDVLTVAATGITVFEALKAYEILKKEGIIIRVVDCYSIKPIDKQTLRLCTSETLNPIVITVEDHFAHGGLGDFVFDALANESVHVEKMAVTKIGRSGLKDELLDYVGISAKHIVKKVRSNSI